MSAWLEDKDAIRDLLSNYCFYIDHGQSALYAALFIEECVWDGGPWGRFEGRSALHDFIGAASAVGGPVSRHFTANEVITVNGDTATARSYVMVVNGAANPPVPAFIGSYEDSFVKVGGRWLFKTRIVT